MTIIDGCSGADEKRRTEELRTSYTLPELNKTLEARGFEISKAALYLRLLPRRVNTREGKRHVHTVPVKLMKPSNDEHKYHDDSRFCFRSIENSKQVAALLGPKQVLVISVDDKAKVPLGLTAAKCQSTMAMNLEHKVSLPDHDFAIASQHKLVPAVTVILPITPNCHRPEAVTNSGKLESTLTSRIFFNSFVLTNRSNDHKYPFCKTLQEHGIGPCQRFRWPHVKP